MYIFRTDLKIGEHLSCKLNIREVYDGFLRLLKLDQNQNKSRFTSNKKPIKSNQNRDPPYI